MRLKSTLLSFSFLYFVIFLYIILSSLFVQSAYSGTFKLKKVNSHYEPELSLSDGIILPGTNIKGGSYTYIADNGSEVSKLGFLIDNEQFYYVESSAYDYSGDTTYGLYKSYFVIDAPGYGSTVGANHLLFLVKYGEKSVQLLDVIGIAYVKNYSMDFVLSSDKLAGRYWQTHIADIDKDDKPEVRLRIGLGGNFKQYFELYFEIVNDQFQVDLNPALYKPLYKQEKHSSTIDKTLTYFIYGFLSQELSISDMKFSLKKSNEESQLLLTLLENINFWNTAFHDIGNEKFLLKQYNLKRR